MRSTSYQRGFTLIEMVMVIIVLGIIGAMVAVFMKAPIDAYFATARRAALSDEADTAMRRMGRDIRKALPNSIRTPSTSCVEFIPTKTGGRYRADLTSGGTGDILDFTAADTSFAMFGANSSLPSDQTIATGDVVAVYNLGIPGADAYAGNNTSVVSGVVSGAESVITMASKQFPFASGSNRFHVIPSAEKVVAYVCDTLTGKLTRTASSTFTSACPTTGAVLANHVSACSFTYNGSDLQRNALLQIGLTFTVSSESVNLYHEVHVNNTP